MALAWHDVLELLHIVVIPMIGYALKVITDIRADLRTLNGRVIRVEQEVTDHKQADEVRFGATEGRVSRLEDYARWGSRP